MSLIAAISGIGKSVGSLIKNRDKSKDSERFQIFGKAKDAIQNIGKSFGSLVKKSNSSLVPSMPTGTTSPETKENFMYKELFKIGNFSVLVFHILLLLTLGTAIFFLTRNKKRRY